MKNRNTRGIFPRKAWIGALIVFLFLILFLAVLKLNLAQRAVTPDAPLHEFTIHMDERIPELMERYGIPGVSIALVKDGKIAWTDAYGYADVEKKRALTVDTPMRVQSISKSVTAWGVMKLIEQGKIDLDAPITRYLKDWKFPPSRIPAERITVRQLLSHTAGLPLGDVFTIYSPEDAKPSLKEKLTKEAAPMREPGSGFSYSNTGYNLLELLIEEVTGQDFAEYMEHEVLSPLEMKRSSFSWKDSLKPHVPVGYDLKGKPVPVYVYPEKASGGLFSTAEDVADFVIAGMKEGVHEGQGLKTESIGALYAPASNEIGIYGLVFEAYGFGHYIETLPNGKKAVSHGGQGTGIMTHFHAVPETGDAIVILTNSQRSWPFISYLLSDWARWRGFPSVGMERILWGNYGLWTAIGLVCLAVLLQMLRIMTGILSGKRKAMTRLKGSNFSRLIQIGMAVMILAILMWCLCQKYLFLSSVFPIAAAWLGRAALALAVIFLLSALFPRTGKCDSAERREEL